MEILPIKSIREEDGPLVGSSLLNLAKLYHFGLPVAQGIIVLAPEIKLKTVLEHFHLKDREVFEQSLILFRSEVQKIEIPINLEAILKRHKIDPKKIWYNLLENWISQIRSRIFREGFSSAVTSNLSSQPVFFTKKVTVSGEAYFDDSLGHSIYKLHHGSLTHAEIDKLDEVIIKANKKLFLPQTLHFIVDEGLKIVKVSPFTQPSEIQDHVASSKYQGEYKKEILQQIPKSSVKVFLDLSESLSSVQSIDGVIVNGEKIPDSEMRKAKLAESASEFNHLPVIYKLPDILDANSDLRGTLRLIHNPELLKKEAECFLYVRNKKRLFNCQIAVPFIRSVNEFLQIKRDLASEGISRKGMLKLWVEFAVPENIINIEEYILAGFDGAIINLDQISLLLSGFNTNSKENTFAEKQVSSLLNFIEDGVKLLRRSNIPVIFSGSLSLHDETMKFLFDKGVFGLCVDLVSISHIHDQLKFVESHQMKHKMVN
jgi:hypothetical protein